MNWTKIKLTFKMEVALIVITSVLCIILLLKILYRLRSVLPWRVNCWFCNINTWVKYPEHNCWTCPKCEQYNGFTKDGDYNKTLMTANDPVSMSPKLFYKHSPKNGLCKMCNINQQLKVTQLANFVPMNDNNFDEEIEAYRAQLEKAYKLCSPCKRVLQVKLHKEKETLLSTKLLENRSPEKKQQTEKKQRKALRDLINNTSMLIAIILLILVSYEFYSKMIEYENIPQAVYNILEIVKGLLDRVASILKMKIFTTFPSAESYYDDFNSEFYIDMLPKDLNFRLKTYFTDYDNSVAQEALGVVACLLQIMANIWNVNSLRYTIAIDLLWTVFVISIAERIVTLNPLLTIFIKMTCIVMLLLVYKNAKKHGRNIPKKQSSPTIPVKKLFNSTVSGVMERDDAMAVDSDDDVSLSKFGLHNLSESSNETMSPLNTSLISGRTFSPRADSIWNKTKLNSTFCVNPVLCSPNPPEAVFAKPSFHKYQKLVKDDSDSDLDESISSLSLGPTKSKKNNTNSIFSLRKFTASPNFVTPTATGRGRPLISPSKLGHSTSWVAGGYWGADGDPQLFHVDGSRSSSQSSGFESQSSSMAARPMFSAPPSREESVCGESAFGQATFGRMSSPVFPTLQYNGHVHIPQPRPAHGLFLQQHYHAMFKTPGSSGLIRLPQVNSFPPH